MPAGSMLPDHYGTRMELEGMAGLAGRLAAERATRPLWKAN